MSGADIWFSERSKPRAARKPNPSMHFGRAGDIWSESRDLEAIGLDEALGLLDRHFVNHPRPVGAELAAGDELKLGFVKTGFKYLATMLGDGQRCTRRIVRLWSNAVAACHARQDFSVRVPEAAAFAMAACGVDGDVAPEDLPAILDARGQAEDLEDIEAMLNFANGRKPRRTAAGERA